LTPNGPSPNIATLGAGALSPLWVNDDQVTHTVVFANGLCSLQVAPGERKYCSNDFFANIGTYPYTVDRTIQASVVVGLNPRTVTLAARSHTIMRGTALTLHGKLVAAHYPPGPSLQPVTVLARHGRGHPFRRIAVVHPKAEGRPLQAIWRLRVGPRTDTTYIAEATYQPDSGRPSPYWQNATSNPFKVAVRARR
jgi:hypothetical protein